MKNIKTLIVALALIVCTQSVRAIQTPSVEAHRAINKDAAEQFKQSDSGKLSSVVNTLLELGNRYYGNLRTCEQIHVHQYIDFFGLKLSFNADVNGWVDGKCQYRITVNIGGVGKDIRDLYDVRFTDEAIAKIKPIIACDFTQENLNILVDAIIASQQQTVEQYKKMLENPAEKYVANSKRKMTPQEEAAVAMLTGGNVCYIQNKEELMNNFSELMNLYTVLPQEDKTPTTDSDNK